MNIVYLLSRQSRAEHPAGFGSGRSFSVSFQAGSSQAISSVSQFTEISNARTHGDNQQTDTRYRAARSVWIKASASAGGQFSRGPRARITNQLDRGTHQETDKVQKVDAEAEKQEDQVQDHRSDILEQEYHRQSEEQRFTHYPQSCAWKAGAQWCVTALRRDVRATAAR